MTFAETGCCRPGDPEFETFMREMCERVGRERQETKYWYPRWRNRHYRGADGKLEEESSILPAGPNEVACVWRGLDANEIWDSRWRASIRWASEVKLGYFRSRHEAKRACEKVLSQWKVT